MLSSSLMEFKWRQRQTWTWCFTSSSIRCLNGALDSSPHSFMNQKSSWAIIVLGRWKPILLNSRKGKQGLVKDPEICISRNKFRDWETLNNWITPVQQGNFLLVRQCKHFSSELSALPAPCNIVCAGCGRTTHFSCPSAGALLCFRHEGFYSVQELLRSGMRQQLGIWQLP